MFMHQHAIPNVTAGHLHTQARTLDRGREWAIITKAIFGSDAVTSVTSYRRTARTSRRLYLVIRSVGMHIIEIRRRTGLKDVDSDDINPTELIIGRGFRTGPGETYGLPMFSCFMISRILNCAGNYATCTARGRITL